MQPETNAIDTPGLRRVIFASSLGTLFEWYDFYLYGSLAVFFGAKFFPPGVTEHSKQATAERIKIGHL